MIRFDISNRNLTSLVGVNFPKNVEVLICWNNQLTNLEGCPSSVQVLNCCNNPLTSLEGCPPSVKTLWCIKNQLISLEDCPPSVQKLYCDNNPLNSEYLHKSLEEIHKINKIKAYRKGILKLNSIIFPTLIQRCFRYYYYDKLNSDGISVFCLRSMAADRKSSILI